MTRSQSQPVDPDGLLEFSVVFTDRSLNHMSQSFQGVMRDLSATLKTAYGAHSCVIVPGGGTYGMESVARQFATDKRALVLRNGWFSYRWTQIFEFGDIPAETSVLKARRIDEQDLAPFAPAPIEEVEAHIRDWRPDILFTPHVETAASSCSTASHPARCGSTCGRLESTFSSRRRRRAGPEHRARVSSC
jgi:aspartate aminotransferase-like enzyme